MQTSPDPRRPAPHASGSNAPARAELRYQALADSMTQMVWATDPEGVHTYFNRRWYEYTGLTEADSLGFGFVKALHPNDVERTLERWRLAWQAGESYEIEYRFRRHDGIYQWFIGRALPVYGPDGQVVEWVGTCTNIDAQRRTSEALNFLAEASALLGESLDYEVTLTRLTQLAVPKIADWCAIDIRDATGAVRRLAVAHIDPSKVDLAQQIRRLAPFDPEAPSGLAYVLRSGRSELLPVINEAMIRESVADPALRDMLLALGLCSSMVVPLIAHGRILGALQLVSAESQRPFAAADLSLAEDLARRAAVAIDNARLYKELRQSDATLRESEQRYRSLAEAMPLIVWLTDDHGRVTYVNQRWIEFTGVGLDAAGQLERGDLLHPDDREATMSHWRACLASQTPYEVEYRFRRHDGAYRWQLVRAVPFYSEAGTVGYWIGTNTDIDDQKQHEASLHERSVQLAQASATLRERNRELDQFAYITSHDLRAPLRGIANLASWIEEDLGPLISDETRSYLELLRGRVSRMEGLINGILHYSRVGRSGGAIELVSVDELLAEVIDLLAPDKRTIIQLPQDLPSLHTERLLLHQVFSNLIGNAVKHYSGDPPLVIDIDWRREGNASIFSVADNGPGIAPAFHERIFGIFQTLAPRDSVEGSGLGLTLVKKIVEHQGGRIWLESQEGQGATFFFSWPERADQP